MKSKQPRKQRKYRNTLELHEQKKLFTCKLAPELVKQYKRRSYVVRTGDTVKVTVGMTKEGKVNRVDRVREQVFIEGAERSKRNGTKVMIPFHPSNLTILELDISDTKRKAKLEGKK